MSDEGGAAEGMNDRPALRRFRVHYRALIRAWGSVVVEAEDEDQARDAYLGVNLTPPGTEEVSVDDFATMGVEEVPQERTVGEAIAAGATLRDLVIGKAVRGGSP